jgi:hypothetical protein
MEQMPTKIMLNQIGAHWANEELSAGYDTYGFGQGIQRLVQSKLSANERRKEASGQRLDVFRKMVVLGRTISMIDTTADGLGVDVLFSGGDQCTSEEEYMTEIRFRCIIEDGDVAEGFQAEELEYIGTEGSECIHVFAWHTSLACPVCRKDQIIDTRGPCETVRSKRLAKRAKYVDEEGKPLSPDSLSALVGVRKVAQKPKPGEMCFVPEMGEKLATPYGDTEPHVFSAALGLEVTESDSALDDQFALRPLTFEQCNKLDDATAMAADLYGQSSAFRYSSSVALCLCACCCCNAVILLLAYLNMRGEHATLYDEVSRENRAHGLPEDYDFDGDTRANASSDNALGDNRISPYDDDDLQHH